MIKLLLNLFGGYMVLESQYLGPYIAKIVTVNTNYGVDTVVLQDNESKPMNKKSVYFIKFFANRKVKKLELALAQKMAEDEILRLANEKEATELEL